MGRVGLLAAVLALGLAALPPVIDWGLSWFKRQDGCRVRGIVDGDTVRLSCAGASARGRLLGVDTPEMKAGCVAEFIGAVRATWALRLSFWSAGHVVVSRKGQGRYGRDLVRLSFDGRDVADEMIRSGLGRAYGGGRRTGWCG